MTNDSVERTAGKQRIFILAYACLPEEGSEPGAGWEFASAAAELGAVTVLTRREHADKIAEYWHVSGNPRFRIVSPNHRLLKLRVLSKSTYLRYASWMLAARIYLLENCHEGDIVHHVTYASDWLPSPITGVRGTSVWGPVGGATRAPSSLLRRLSRAAALKEVLRMVVGTAFRCTLTRRTILRSNKVIALNEDSSRILAKLRGSEVAILKNAVVRRMPQPRVERTRRMGAPLELIYVGRLVEWKGLGIILPELAAFPEPWKLRVLGQGPDRQRFENLADSLGIAASVEWMGHRSREEVFAYMQAAHALLFPSLHDSAPWTVAEATSMGLPTVCFPLGGAPEMAKELGLLLDPRDVRGSLFSALRRVGIDAKRCGREDFSPEALVSSLRIAYGVRQ